MLMNTRNYEFLSTNGYVANCFKSISNDYLCVCELVEWEFINEFNQLETGIVTMVPYYFDGVRKNINYYFVDVLQYLKHILTTSVTKRIAFKSYQYLIKSVIYFSALDIEKIIGLVCLGSFCQVDDVKWEVFNDEKFIEYLKEIKNVQTNDDSIKFRLSSCIIKFLQINA